MKTKTQICQDIISTVARLFGLKADTVTGRLRTRRIVDARFIAMWLCRKKTGLVDRELACLFGKERSSIAYAIKKVPEWRETDPVFRELFEMASERVAAKTEIPIQAGTVEPVSEISINFPEAVTVDLPDGWSFTQH